MIALCILLVNGRRSFLSRGVCPWLYGGLTASSSHRGVVCARVELGSICETMRSTFAVPFCEREDSSDERRASIQKVLQ